MLSAASLGGFSTSYQEAGQRSDCLSHDRTWHYEQGMAQGSIQETGKVLKDAAVSYCPRDLATSGMLVINKRVDGSYGSYS